jgi:predicted amidohydrolase
MRIAIGQINCTVGDLSGNSRKILEYAERAKAGGADLLLTPELSLCGYPPEDLLLREDFCDACESALLALARQVHGIGIVVGHPDRAEGRLYNAAWSAGRPHRPLI